MIARRFSDPTLRLLDARQQCFAADNAAYYAAKALECSAPEDITAAFRCAAIARDYATGCRARYSQLRGVALTRQCSCGYVWASTEAMRAECEPAGILTMAGSVIEQGTCRHCGSTRAVTCRRDTEELQRLERYHALAYAGYGAGRVSASVVADAYGRAATMRDWLEQVEVVS